MHFDYHKSVLVHEVLNGLKAETARVVFDATLGDGGHVLEFLQKMPPDGIVVGIDRDPDALSRAGKRLESFGNRFIGVKGNFSDIDIIAKQLGIAMVDGIVADLGVSRLQISDPARGFMFLHSGPLLMRMGDDSEVDAEQVINEFDEKELARIIWEYGEEKASRKIARAIVHYRQKKRIETTEELANILRSVTSFRFEIKTFARVFQAIRIYVNREMESLEAFLPAAVSILRPGGRLAVISYHSLEDRITKHYFRQEADPCICPKSLPACVCGRKPVLKLVGKMTIPENDEIEINSSSRSAKLRIAERV